MRHKITHFHRGKKAQHCVFLSRLSSFFKEFRYFILKLIIGKGSKDYVQEILQQYKKLSLFQPLNTLEFVMTKPSDIWAHLPTLYMLTVEYNLRTIVELGTAEGESTVTLLQAASQIGGVVYSIDIARCPKAHEIIKRAGLYRCWNFIQADDLQFVWNQPIDHLFIDTSHLYEHTLKELQKYEPHVREGGIITLHDIVSFPEVMAAITTYTKNRGDLRLYKYFHNNGLAIIFKGK